jgi:hypothetical protein
VWFDASASSLLLRLPKELRRTKPSRLEVDHALALVPTWGSHNLAVDMAVGQQDLHGSLARCVRTEIDLRPALLTSPFFSLASCGTREPPPGLLAPIMFGAGISRVQEHPTPLRPAVGS